MKRQKWIFVLLNIFIVFQLTVMVISPNRSSVLHDYLSPYFNWYSVPLHFINPWSFFSPDPSVAVYWEYSYIYDAEKWSGSSESMYEAEAINHIYPSKASKIWSNRFLRNLYHSRYAAFNEKHFNAFFLPWLCSQEDHIEAVSLIMRFQLHPDIEANQAAQNTLKQAQSNYNKFTGRNIYSCYRGEQDVLF